MKPFDGAGRPFNPVSLSSLARDPRMADPRFALMIERTGRAQLMHLGHATPIAFAITLAVLLPLAGIGGLLLKVPFTAVLILIMAIAIGCIILGRVILRARSTPQVIAVLLRHGVCASCGYDLARESADGPLVRCPECGCAWDRARITAQREGGAYTWGDDEALRRARRPFAYGPVPFGPVRTIDAHGRAVPLVSSHLRAQIAATPDGPHRQRLLDTRAELQHIGRWKRMGVGVLLCGLGVSRFFLGGAPSGGMRSVLAAAFPFALFVYFGVQFARGSFGTPGRALVAVLLRRQLCPTCAADLAPAISVMGRDPASECPDCGAAWRVGDALKPHPPVA